MAIKGTLFAITKTPSEINTQNIFKAMVKESEETGAVVIDGRNIAAGSIYANQIHADAITARHIRSDAITADHIGAGVVDAGKITTGTLQSQNNNSWLNLNNGSFSFGNGSILYQNNQLRITASSINIGTTAVATKKELEEIELTPGPRGPQGNPGTPGAPGADAYTVILTNESHTFAGNETSALSSSVTLNVLAYRGASQVPSSIGSVSGHVEGLTSSVSGNNTINNRLTVNVTPALTTQSGTLTLPITIDGRSFTRTFSFSLALRGTTGAPGSPGSPGAKGDSGANAQLIKLTASGQIFTNPKVGAVTPATITVTGTAQHTTIASWQYSTNGGSFTTALPTGVSRSGNTVTLNGSQMNARTIAIKAFNGSVEDVLTVAKVEDGIDGAPGVSILSVDVEYYRSTSSSSLVGGNWSTTAPNWLNGTYIWSRTKTTYSSGLPTTSDPVCITGQEGATGRGISSITEEYAISPSKTTPPAQSEWKTEAPEWSTGQYMWTRSKIVYTNPAGTEYTTPIVDTAWEAIDVSLRGISLRDKTEILSGTEIYTDKADDSVVHVDIDGKSVGGGSGKNLSPVNTFTGTVFSTTATLNAVNRVIAYNIPISSISTYTLSGIMPSNLGLFMFATTTKVNESITGHNQMFTHVVPSGIGIEITNYKVPVGYNYVTITTGGSFQNSLHSVGTSLTWSNIQLEEGSTATAYEPPAPTPDYPIAINSLNNIDVVSQKSEGGTIDGIEIGGRNLVPNSNDFVNGWSHWQGASITRDPNQTVEEWGTHQATRIRTSGGTSNIKTHRTILHNRNIIRGQDYVYSVYIKNIGNSTMRVNSNYGPNVTIVPGETTRVIFHIRGDDKSSHMQVQFNTLNPSDSLDFFAYGVQLEEGTKVTGWTPAPEDITEDSNHPLIDKINLLLSEPLRSVGDVADRLYRDNEDGLWKVERNVGEVIFNGSTNWGMETVSQYGDGRRFSTIVSDSLSRQTRNPISSSHFGQQGSGGENLVNKAFQHGSRIFIYPPSSVATSVSELQTWLSNNNVVFQYELEDNIVETLNQELQDKLNNLRSFQDSNYVYALLRNEEGGYY